MTPTQLISRAIVDELGKQQPGLDLMPGLRSVTVEVKLVKETGTVRTVIVRHETESK